MTKPKSDMEKLDLGYDIKFSFSEVFGESWLKPLSPLFQSNYMHNLLLFLHEVYSDGEYPRPRSKEVFQVFREVPFDNVRVVILVDGAPDNHVKGNGIALATRPEEQIRPRLVTQTVWKSVERSVYKGMKLDFDVTLQHWLNQGVFPIHTSLTTIYKNGKDPHKDIWKHFIREFITTISEKRSNVIFILLGSGARQYKHHIDSFNHHILEYFNPRYAIQKHIGWNCPCFVRANQILKSIERTSDNLIEW